jgi:hypothetical protein
LLVGGAPRGRCPVFILYLIAWSSWGFSSLREMDNLARQEIDV